MTPEEIVATMDGKNRELLEAAGVLDSASVLALLNAAAMHGFRLGGQVALSMVKGSIAIQIARVSK